MARKRSFWESLEEPEEEATGAESAGAADDERPAPRLGFTAHLGEPAEEVRVGGKSYFVHRSVLRQIPYFAAKCGGEWRDATEAEVELPCTADEFGLILQRLYSGNPLTDLFPPSGGPRFASMLRLAQAAAFIGLEDELPELPALLRGSIRTAEDVEAANAAAASLPERLGKAMAETGPQVPPDTFVTMITQAKTPKVQDAVSETLKSHSGRLDLAVLTKAVGQLISKGSKTAIKWGARIARENLDCASATAVFENCISRSFQCNAADTELKAELRAEFWKHVERCAERGVAASALMVAFPRGPGPSCSICSFSASRTRQPSNCSRPVNPLQLTMTQRADLVNVVRLSKARPGAAEAIAEVLLKFPPADLAAVASADLLAELPRPARRGIGEVLMTVFGTLTQELAVEVVRSFA